LDEKGRVTIPREFREELGEDVLVKKTEEGILLVPGKRKEFLTEMEEEPRRTGKPANPSPARMKAIWKGQ